MADPVANKVAFELVSPERVLASLEADMVVVPAAEGDLGVLPEHAPVLALLRPGVVQVFEGNEVSDRVFVAGGFAEINERGCIVLADAAEPLAEIDLEGARAALRDAQGKLDGASDPSEQERERLERAVAAAQAKVEVAEAR